MQGFIWFLYNDTFTSICIVVCNLEVIYVALKRAVDEELPRSLVSEKILESSLPVWMEAIQAEYS